RRLLATPLFAAFAVLSLAVGVGVTTAVYSVVESIFWKDSGIGDPGSLAFITSADNGRLRAARLSIPDYHDLLVAQKSFVALGAAQQVQVAAALPSKTEVLRADAVSGDYFRTLGVRASSGRLIEPRDDEAAAPVVVVSEAMWRKRFNADRQIIGRSLRLSGQTFEIIGVAQRPFLGTEPRGPFSTGLWVPLATAASFSPRPDLLPVRPPPTISARDRRSLSVVGRLRPGVSADAAGSDMLSIASALDRTDPQHAEFARQAFAPRKWNAQTLDAMTDEATDEVNRLGLLMVGLVGLVLVVACTNLSNLVLARGINRQQEFAIRRALGASRARLVREQAAESLLIAVAGAIASYIVLQTLTRWMTTDFAMDQRWTLSIEPVVNLEALLVAGVAVVLSLLVFGLEPALALTRSRDVRAELGNGTATVGLPRAQRQRTLLRWQVAISAGFFIIATMCVRYTIEEIRHDSGIDIDGLGIAAVNFHSQGWPEARVRLELDRVMDEARRQPGIESVAVSTGLPFGTSGNPQAALGTVDKPISSGSSAYSARVIAGTPSIFKTLGIPVLQGRGFDDRDQSASMAVVVINETAARGMFGTTNAIGRELIIKANALSGDQPVRNVTVIGVAKDTDGGRYLSQRRYPQIYMPLAQLYHPFLTITARSAVDSATAVGELQRAIRNANADIAIEYAGTARTVLTGPFVFLRAAGTLAVSLGALTLLLAMVGLFGIQSHTVAYRTREIGVRMAFGATAAQINRMVLKDGYIPVAQGLAIGVFIGFTGRAIIRSYMDADISIVDPWMFLIVPVPLVLAAFCACYWPARRASRVDPQVALRSL
ncbi:MAG: ABC transporter permease, partial [Vicinamibacterales bacterium]